MAYSVELFKKEPIVLLTAGVDWSPVELDRVMADLRGVFDASPQPLHLVSDLRGMSLEYDQLLRGSVRMTRDEHALLRHPRLNELVVVADDPTVLKAAKTLKQPEFDGISVTVTRRLAEALLRLNVRGLSSALKTKVSA